MTQHNQIYNTHDVIFEKGDEGTCAYIVNSGQVEIFVEQAGVITPLALLGPGEFLGEMAIIDGQRRSASARATQPTQLTSITREQVSERIQQADSVVRHLIRILVKRLRVHNTHELQIAEKPYESEQVIEKMQFESELLQALEKNELHMNYQPIVDLTNLRTAGYEALVRWKSPTRGPVRPDIFMGLAEETSLILPIGSWIIEQCVRDLSELHKKFPNNPNLYISINISGKQFEHENFCNILEAAVQKYGVSRSTVYLEITERVLMTGGAALLRLEQLNQLGYRILLDDFGTGYSSLSYLVDLPLHILKIDQSFVRKALTDPKSLSLCKCIANIARDLQLKTVAEGLETQEYVELMQQMGCNFGQGYHFSKPLPFSEIIPT